MIPRFYDIQNGSVKVDGSNVKTLNPVSIRKHIGMVPQKAQLFKGTLRENMRWGRKNATDEEIYQALEIAQAKEFVDSKDQGLDLMIEQNGSNLSGGQKQRLTIARALVKNPDILILDEVLSVGDAKFRKKSEKKILSMMDKGVTVLFVSHSLEQVKRICTKAMILENGSIRSIGDIDTVSAEYEEMISGD